MVSVPNDNPTYGITCQADPWWQKMPSVTRRIRNDAAAWRPSVAPILDEFSKAIIEQLQVGFTREALIGVTVNGDVTPVVETLAAMPEVTYCVITAGSFDVICEVVCEDDDHLFDVINRRIRTIPGVRGTESFVYLKLSKQTYAW